MKLSDVDLNLFVVFDAIYTEGNLTRAGEIIGITQPAVSNSLSRLRSLFNDPLFVRTADGMVPTPIAQNIIGPVRQSLGLIRSSIQESDSFNPLSSEKRFRVSMTDLTQAIMLPWLFSRIKRTAPMISIDSYQVHRRDMNIELASGNLDLAIDIPLTPDPQIKQAPLFSHPYVVVVRRDHPLVHEDMSIETYLDLNHIHISSRRGGLGHVDLSLGKMGRKRNIVLRTQHYLSTPELVSRTDLALTVPSIYGDFLVNNAPVQYKTLPFEVPHLETHLYWHDSTDRDQANQWIRELILTLSVRLKERALEQRGQSPDGSSQADSKGDL
ncbi:MAG: LysR family transcriptional regulator [Proteobacteria bacterium]|nr:LysR family transcriptional regulator [Pseudomonadota bacterium]